MALNNVSWCDYGTYDESAYPQLWKGVAGAWCPSLGPTGNNLRDLSLYKNLGTLTNMDPATDWVVSGGQYALDFDGFNDWVSVSRSATYNSTQWRTLSAWINARTFDGQFGYNDIMSCDFIGGTREWVFATSTDANLTDAKVGIGIFGTGGGVVGAETPEIILANEWTHVAATHDGSYTFGGYALYINGKQQTLTDTSSGTFTAPSVGTTNLGIGRRPGTFSYDLHWNGLIDDCAIWTRTLTPNEIRKLYLLGRAGIYRTPRKRRNSAFTVYPSISSKASIISVKPASPSFENGFAPRDGEAENPNLLKGLVGAWCPSLGITGSTLRDVSGSNRHGTIEVQTPPNAWVSRSGKYAILLNANGRDCINAGSLAGYVEYDFTLSLWVRKLISTGPGTTYNNIWGLCRWNTGGSPGTNEYMLAIGNGDSGNNDIPTSGIEIGTTNTTVVGTTPIPIGKWCHIALVRRGTSLTQYLDGKINGTATCGSGPIINRGRNCKIGDSDIGADLGTGTDAEFDDAAVYNRALTVNEIKLLASQRAVSYTLKSQKKITTSSSRNIPKSKSSRVVKPPKANTDNLLKGIIGCWSPSLGVTGNTLRDVSGRNNHGTLTNMDAGTDWLGASVRGVSGRVVDYDGTNDYVTCGTRLNATLTGPLSISVWGAFRARSSVGAMVSNIASGGASGFALEIGRTANRLSWLQNGASVDATSTGSIADADWHHVAVTRSGTTGSWTITFAIDGVISTHTTTANPVAASLNGSLAVGRFGDYAPSGYLNAQIGEVAIYNRALTQPEVLELFRRGNGTIGESLTQKPTRSNFTSKTLPSTWLKVNNDWIEAQLKVATGSKASIITRPPIEPSYKTGYAPRDGEPLYPNLQNALVGAWCPSLGVTGRTLRDVSRRNNHGILNINPATDWVVSNGQYALYFLNSYARVSSNMPQWRAMSVWVSLNTTGATQGIAESYGAGTLSKGLELFANASGKASFDGRDLGGTYRSSGVSTTTVVGVGWVHLFGQFSDRLEIWVNGVRESQTATALSGFSTTIDLNIGGIDAVSDGVPATAWASGLIDDLLLYNRVLTASEIRQLYLLGRGGALTLKQPPLKATSTIWQSSQPRLYTGDWT